MVFLAPGGCQPAGTSEKVMEVGMATERVHLIGLLAPWTIEGGECEAELGLGGVM